MATKLDIGTLLEDGPELPAQISSGVASPGRSKRDAEGIAPSHREAITVNRAMSSARRREDSEFEIVWSGARSQIFT